MRAKQRLANAAQRTGEALYRLADAVTAAPFIRESHTLPPLITVGSKQIDTAEDLAAFTQLDRAVVVEELQRRRRLNFRGEWFSTNPRIRDDHWFYLSSKTYLFANAVHFSDGRFASDFVRPLLDDGGRVLDFGGGTGELALRLAGEGIPVSFVELNALQRDFVRFRIARHDLGHLIDVLDPWAPIPQTAFAAVTALDVLEHLPDAQAILAEKLLPALTPTGVLIENTPFIADVHNPMHHSDFGFAAFMAARGYVVVEQDAAKTRCWRPTSGR